jgi:ComF family protein
MVARYKYAGDPAAGRVLADLVAGAAIRRARNPDLRPACLVPVPLHPGRARERGFDQAEELARRLARRVAVPLRPGLLERVRPTRPQAGLPAAARRRNLRNAFRAAGGEVPERLTLVDDVLTTGATVAAAATALRRAGAREVEIWCLARAGDQR